MAKQIEITLESLRPTKVGKIMALVAEAGINVVPWAVKQDGSQVKNPGANPHYCYEWAFGGNGEPTALCVWHPHLQIADDMIVYEDNIRELTMRLERMASERSNPSHVKSRSRDQAKRAQKFDSLLQRAYWKSEPVRLVVLMGDDTGADQPGWERSNVRYRALDQESWYVHSYSHDDGSFRLVRGIPTNGVPENTTSESVPLEFVDQFSVPDSLEKRESNTSSFPRSQEVRQKVLNRAGGICECCGEPGFRMKSGAIFLETHHVVSLWEGGPDVEWNVVAICPNDHRRAHFSEVHAELRDQLIAKLLAIYPGADGAFRAMRAGNNHQEM